MYTPGPDETVLRIHWNWYAHGLTQTGLWAPGSSVTKVGIVWTTEDGPFIPLPLTNPDADWLDMQTASWSTQYIPSGSNFFVEYHSVAGVPDFDTKSMRRQITEGVPYKLAMCWESLTNNDTASEFKYGAVGTWSILLGSRPA